MIRSAAAATLALAALATAAVADPLPPEQSAIKAHVSFLAADALKGREAGTPEYDIAAEYVASEMLSAGLEPAAGDGKWLQPVPLAAARVAGTPELTLNGSPLAYGTDFTIRPVAGPATLDVSAPVVFVGHGVVDKANGIDDYKGLDVRGKIVAMLYSGPKGLNSEVAAHLGNRLDRARTAKAKGAVGAVYLYTNQLQGVLPFERMATFADGKVMAWANPPGAAARDLGAPSVAILSFAGAEKLFAGSRLSWAGIRAAADAGTPLPRGALAATLGTKQRFTVERVQSSNVVGVLRGSDPKLRGEYVVLSAHLDHVGITAPDDRGDTINNGALDNAMGIASMLEVAKAVQASGVKPKRSLLFVAVTAEEKGLVGSDYFAQHPTVPAKAMVANVNLDMPIMTYRFQDLVAYGADRSTIADAVGRAAAAEGLKLVPDPDPEEAVFTRTDHYSFVRAGVPSVSLDLGPGGPGAKASAEFLSKHYHMPSDDLSLPIDWQAAATFVRINTAVARDLANAPTRPAWKTGDYFGGLYAGER